ncbi:hypothetical protein H0274_08625 [Altererythrobacter sp. CC-YST694]|uniref:hypothetical protein n=1 Tax=Altererythrobacter sp. CC-YST694 TaxID=2755038 RepID=UPI001D01E33F|nr:hypothetical protein [Altererythrobacter sp. CC-YST694]MCB5425318.1 hypothetical protein [Altererythrobacter sp. CC-YST694]
MYEASIIPADRQTEVGETSSPEGEQRGRTLRPLSWGEIASRLAAAEDFRRLAARRHHFACGSFNDTSARHLATLGEGKHTVNPIVLANGKIADGIDLAVTSEETHGVRGR